MTRAVEPRLTGTVRDNNEFTFGPRLRRCVLTVHIVVSVGWLGVDLCVLVLGALGSAGGDPTTARAALVVLGPIGDYLLIPLPLLTLISGVVLAWGTPWKLLRYYWVIVSLVLTTAAAAAVLLLLRPKLENAAALARAGSAAGVQLVVAPSVALVLLCAITAINVYKPWGRVTSRGRR
jgi:hypothetical protein